MEYEFTVALDIDANHKAQASKDRTTMFEGFYDTITEATGRQLLNWLDRGDEAPAAPPAPLVEAPLPLIGPDAKEYTFKGVEAWQKAALKAVGMMSNDAAALGMWQEENRAHFTAVAERHALHVDAVEQQIDMHLSRAASELMDQEKEAAQ
jgi:hypothetical protein